MKEFSMNRRKQTEGMTLIELMITCVISAIVILTVSLVLFVTFREWRADNIATQFRRDTALTVQALAKDARESTADDLVTTVNSISFTPNEVRTGTTITYVQDGETLLKNVNGALAGEMITGGLQQFSPIQTAGGVQLRIELADDEFNITLTSDTFISTRNRE